MYRNATSTAMAPIAIHGSPALREPACSIISFERLYAITSKTPDAKLTKKCKFLSMRGPTPRQVTSLPDSETSMTSTEATSTDVKIMIVLYRTVGHPCTRVLTHDILRL